MLLPVGSFANPKARFGVLPLLRIVGTHTDGPALNGALAATGRLLAVFSMLLAAGVLLS